MIITLLGYMGSGKSTIGMQLATILDYSFIDLDHFIEEKEQLSIKEIFETKGEIYFRKVETLHLKEIVSQYKNVVLSVGGGTPCYSNNIDLINSVNAIAVYLKLSPKILSDRLFLEKENRPLISHIQSQEALLEYISIHLFERQNYYQQASYILNTDNLSVRETLEAIVNKLY